MNGIIFPSYMEGAVSNNANWDPNYPSGNACDLVRPSKVARRLAAGTAFLSVTFLQTVSIRAIALIGHNAPAGTFKIQAYSGPGGGGDAVGPNPTYDFWPAGSSPVPSCRAVRPVLLPAALECRSIVFEFGNIGVPFEIQAVEAGGFWEWPMGYGRELGLKVDDTEIVLAGGASYRPESNLKPRTVRGAVDLMKMEETATTGLDFQKGLDIQRPFVWAEDWEDPATWARKCLLVRNEEVSPMVGALYRRDRFPINLIEHQK